VVDVVIRLALEYLAVDQDCLVELAAFERRPPQLAVSSAVSPATSNSIDAASNGTNRPSQGAGVNSGALNNGTTGDTIGTGPGTSSKPSAGQGTTSPLAAGGRKE
jgi:hypothetical protein